MKDLNDKVVCITGASAGIGYATACAFASKGAHLLLMARRQERLKQLAKKLQEQFKTKSFICSVDVGNRKQVKKVFSDLTPSWRKIDILVNNAGLALGKDKIQEICLEDAEIVVNTNVLGLLYVTSQVLPGMIERKSGHIINLGSIAGHEPYSGGSVYCATKFAVHALSRSMKMDVLGHNIKVTSIDPGMVYTEFSKVRFKGNKDKAEKIYEGIHPLSAEDVADVIVYCATRPPHVNINEVIMMPTEQAGVAYYYRENPPHPPFIKGGVLNGSPFIKGGVKRFPP